MTPDEHKAYWDFIEEVSRRVAARPAWQRGAIDRPANIYRKATSEVPKETCRNRSDHI